MRSARPTKAIAVSVQSADIRRLDEPKDERALLSIGVLLPGRGIATPPESLSLHSGIRTEKPMDCCPALRGHVRQGKERAMLVRSARLARMR